MAAPTMEDLGQVIGQLQQQVVEAQQENQTLQERMTNYESQTQAVQAQATQAQAHAAQLQAQVAAGSPTHVGLGRLMSYVHYKVFLKLWRG